MSSGFWLVQKRDSEGSVRRLEAWQPQQADVSGDKAKIQVTHNALESNTLHLPYYCGAASIIRKDKLCHLLPLQEYLQITPPVPLTSARVRMVTVMPLRAKTYPYVLRIAPVREI